MSQPVSMRREIFAILLIKLLLIILIKWLFFSTPIKPDDARISAVMLTSAYSSSIPARSHSHE